MNTIKAAAALKTGERVEAPAPAGRGRGRGIPDSSLKPSAGAGRGRGSIVKEQILVQDVEDEDDDDRELLELAKKKKKSGVDEDLYAECYPAAYDSTCTFVLAFFGLRFMNLSMYSHDVSGHVR